MRPEVTAALARLDARQYSKPEYRPITWNTNERSRRCWRCRSATTLRILSVRHVRRPARSYAVGRAQEWHRAAERFSTLSGACIDEVACKARSDAAYDRRRARSGNLRWAQSRFESPNLDLPKGTCRWCGEAIVFVEGVPYRFKRRERHRGDEWEVGERNCRREHDRTFAMTPRHLIMHRGDPCCVDCGTADVWVQPDDGGEGWWLPAEWEADHDVAIADGGAHSPVNICRRCVPCHRAKTIAEARARRELAKPQAAG